MQKTLVVELTSSKLGLVFFLLVSLLCALSFALTGVGLLGLICLLPVCYYCVFLSKKYFWLSNSNSVSAIYCRDDGWSLLLNSGQTIDVTVDGYVFLFDQGVALLFHDPERKKNHRVLVMLDSTSPDSFRQLKARLNIQSSPRES